MREIQCLAGSEVLLQCGPYAHHSRIAQQTHHDCSLLGSLFNREQGFAGNPTIADSLVIGLALTLANNHIETVVTQVASLAGTLHAITDYGDGLVLQHLACLLQGKFFTGHHFFDDATKIQFCHFLFYFNIILYVLRFCFFANRCKVTNYYQNTYYLKQIFA